MEKKETLWQNIKGTWQFAKKEKGSLIVYATVSIIEGIISAFLPIISAKIILSITDGLFEQLFYTALAVFGIQAILYMMYYFKGVFFQKIYKGTLNCLQLAVAEETLKLEIKEVDKASSGVFIDRLNQDTKEISSMFMEFTYWMSQIISNIGVLVAIFILNRYLFVFCLFSSFLLFCINKIRLNRQYKIQKNVKKLRERTTSLTSELVRGIRDIKVLNAKDSILEQTADRIYKASDEEVRMLTVQRRYNLLENNISNISDFLFLVLGCYFCTKNLLTIPTFVIVYNYQSKVKNLMMGVVQILEYLKKFSVAASRVFEVILDKKFEKEKFGEKHLGKTTGHFAFQDVVFGYKEDMPIIKNMSFTVNANETVAFVGKSGAGKTTIFSLLTRLYHPSAGKIFLDGIDITELDCSSIRDNMSIITQNSYIFNFSIKDNLLLARPSATMQEIREACQMACLDEFIMSLPEGYETMVGEGGLALSGGQRQRLAIARALLMKTEIILFDEATSALDNETQSEIQNAIHNMQGEYTILMIAHRLSTVVDSDRIYVVDDGRVVAEGTHKQLLKNSSFYRALYEKDLKNSQ